MEVWKDCRGYEDVFQVSSIGRVYSKRSNKLLKTHTAKSGYVSIVTRVGGRNSKAICLKIHRLVAETFLPEPEGYLEESRSGNVYGVVYVNHLNGVKHDNRVENLEWCTQSENMLHSYETGLSNAVVGEANHISKLSGEDIVFVRENYKPRCRVFGGRALARRLGVSHSTIQAVLNEVTWKN